ncbi:hypothetical protein [Sulfitobacter sp. MOLA879]|uniref:hypothetical protein n=1 Tax=Sulfitobacter sp. MOLA879 TaxID=3368579 RepID=UPI003746ECBF
MNWTSALVEKKVVKDTPYDEDLFGVASDRGAHLEMLEYWLDKEFWDFDRGYCQFEGASEGHCILAGIEPENSKSTNEQYGPAFLPASIEFYGYSKITAEEQWRLKDAIDRRISDLKSLGLRGRVSCHHALDMCSQYKLDPPWLDVAQNDFECAKRLPPKLRTNNKITQRISKVASSKGGSNRAKKDPKSKILDTIVREEFEKLRQNGFHERGLRTKDGRPNATAIANKIYHVLSKDIEDSEDYFPKLTTFESRIRKWLENSIK